MITMRPSRSKLLMTAALWLVLARGFVVGQVLPITSTTPDQEARQSSSTRDEILAERERTNKEFQSAHEAVQSATAQGQPIPKSVSVQVDFHNRLDLLYGQILAAMDQHVELTTTRDQTATDLANFRTQGLIEKRPFTFQFLESLRDQLQKELLRDHSQADASVSADAAQTGAKSTLEQLERTRRQAKETLDNNKEESRTAELTAALRLAELESRVAAKEVRLREIENSNQKLESDARNLQITFLREKIELAAKDTRFSRSELDEYLAQLDQADSRLKQNLDTAQADLTVRDTEWIETRHRFEASSGKESALTEEFAARELARRLRQRETVLIGQQLQSISDSQKAWSRRYQIINGRADDATAKVWESECTQTLAQIDSNQRVNNSRLTEIRLEATTLDTKINATTESSPEVNLWLNRQKQYLATMISNCQNTIDQLEATRRLLNKLLIEISAQVSNVTWNERLSTFWGTVLEIWNYELTSIQDSPITVRKIVIGIVLLVVGLFISRRVVDWVGHKFLPRFGLTEGAIAAIQSLIFYLLILTVAMISLRIVNVPLTAFTILGGALAIGVGFGSQNIVNNFISGLIILAERPVRVGDLVQIDDLVGVIEYIGPRSTRVLSSENMDIIVPNSSFLEKNVVNWTLSNDRYRAHITVGVMYGSPIRDVMKLIRKALDEHGKVLPKPEPVILFTDFGDNALMFEAHFWIRMRRMMDRRIIESDIRSRIDSLFREAHIVIAYPQRDLHIDTLKPLQVELLPHTPISTPEDHTEGNQS